MPREVISAKNGTVSVDATGVNDVTDISITEETDGQEYATSSTSGKKFETAGHSKKSGSFTATQHNASVLRGKVGTVVVLILTSDGTVELFNGSALLKSSTPSIPVGGGDNISRVFNWAEAEAC